MTVPFDGYDLTVIDYVAKIPTLLDYLRVNIRENLELLLNKCLNDDSDSPSPGSNDELWHTLVKPFLEQVQDFMDSVSETRIGFVGERGAGKSTLVNCILRAQLLPTAEDEPATASISEV